MKKECNEKTEKQYINKKKKKISGSRKRTKKALIAANSRWKSQNDKLETKYPNQKDNFEISEKIEEEKALYIKTPRKTMVGRNIGPSANSEIEDWNKKGRHSKFVQNISNPTNLMNISPEGPENINQIQETVEDPDFIPPIYKESMNYPFGNFIIDSEKFIQFMLL